ncbi:hypothetical protein GGS26DRAFT_589609 [Hypomontagnella submonticulosa]|nr:hypothetical protein GGS26DRAFT_589609 [Hypomontagnella submonticulosa]
MDVCDVGLLIGNDVMKLETEVDRRELPTVGPILLVTFEVGKGGMPDIAELKLPEPVAEDTGFDVEIPALPVLMPSPEGPPDSVEVPLKVVLVAPRVELARVALSLVVVIGSEESTVPLLDSLRVDVVVTELVGLKLEVLLDVGKGGKVDKFVVEVEPPWEPVNGMEVIDDMVIDGGLFSDDVDPTGSVFDVELVTGNGAELWLLREEESPEDATVNVLEVSGGIEDIVLNVDSEPGNAELVTLDDPVLDDMPLDDSVELGTKEVDEVEFPRKAELPVSVAEVFDSPVPVDVGAEPLGSPVALVDEVLLVGGLLDVEKEAVETLDTVDDPREEVSGSPPEPDPEDAMVWVDNVEDEVFEEGGGGGGPYPP